MFRGFSAGDEPHMGGAAGRYLPARGWRAQLLVRILHLEARSQTTGADTDTTHFEPYFWSNNDHFTKTGSGQTSQTKLSQKAKTFSFCRCGWRPICSMPLGSWRSSGQKTEFLSHLYIKTSILPRQARDTHREKSPKRPFLLRVGFCRSTCVERSRCGQRLVE